LKKLLLRNRQSPGDIVMLTAAVRDLHIAYPGRFLTDVRTSCGALWEHNPRVTPLSGEDPEVELIDCGYPLIHHSNRRPFHFIHGFTNCLSEALGLNIQPTLFRGDIFLAREERRWISQVQEITGMFVPFWLIVAGGKRDYTIKWWDHGRFQEVVDHFRGRILFVQTGDAQHVHRPLRGVIDLRGKTNLRQFVRLMHHAQGVVCPVTFAMHLAAAVEPRPDQARHRPCVVVAGGRESPHWEAYPHHQFIHTVGALPCCAHGGCWKARTVSLGDGDEKDGKLCVNVAGDLPRCMDMISAEEVIRRIALYFDGGVTRYLNGEEAECAAAAIAKTAHKASSEEIAAESAPA
jgi:ADP-heptose:LPS heptosyltransferase